MLGNLKIFLFRFYFKILPQKIQEEMPSDPYEAEMLLLARASSENAESEARNEQTENVPLTNLSENDDQGAEVSSLDNFTMCKLLYYENSL